MAGYYKADEVIKFVEEFINNGFDQNAAMKVVSPHLKGKSLVVKASRWVHDTEIQRAILNRIESLDLNEDKARRFYNKILSVIINDNKTRPSDKIKALEVQATLLGLYTKKEHIEIKDITEEDKNSLEYYRNRIYNTNSSN